MDDMNLVSLVARFADDKKCRAYLEALRWPDGPTCPRCKATKIYRILEREQFVCDSCDYQFSVTVNTIFHDSHLPLWKWFLAVYLMMESKKAMSANQLKRTLDVSYKTAWYLCHRIRKAIEEVNPRKLRGTVEVDETFIGGVKRGYGAGYRGNKVVVLGAIERGGPLRMTAEKQEKRPTKRILHGFIAKEVAPDAQRIITDSWRGYRGIADHDTKHETVNHLAKEWVRGDIHTNSIESAWSLFKRGLIGSYHKISVKHFDAYLDEFEWRFNNRANPFLFRDTLLKLIASPNLEYKKLTKEPAA
jgi:transposase-like protein